MASQGHRLWRQMVSGTPVYSVAVTVIWAMCAATVLVVLAVTVPGVWPHVGFGLGALAEVTLSVLTLRFLARAAVRGRFDV